ncbi:unnamed protein product [Orchesella dallaii]|uniref:Cupin-like domain-containing protein n=1 Tax=Orchesella dallaii TaxID=48710 RepID=A0ABP1PQU0_9HEXA
MSENPFEACYGGPGSPVPQPVLNNGTGHFEDVEPHPNYNFITGNVPCYDFNDPVALNLIKEQVPVILRGADLVSSAMKWDLDYLSTHIGGGRFAVFIRNAAADRSAVAQLQSSSNQSQSCQPEPLHIFKYFDEKKLAALQEKSTFQSTMVRIEMTFQEFLKRFQGDRSQERVYLQQPLNNTVGPQIASDFIQFNWSWAAEHKKEFNWGPLTSNLLLIGQKGNITPCHFDEQQNLFCPLRGRKKIILFNPDNFPYLYPYPVHHPNDRQSQVNLDNPDMGRFPKFAMARAVQATGK